MGGCRGFEPGLQTKRGEKENESESESESKREEIE
jgi:hypothetical protein